MKEITADQNYTSKSLPEEEELEPPRLSFCDLPIAESDSGFTNQSPITAQPDLLFDFFASQPAPAHSNQNAIVFCGKNINEQKVDYFATTKSKSFRKETYSDAANRKFAAPAGLIRSKCPTADRDYHVHTVNITSLTSMSAKSRRRMFMLGPVKFKPEMELSAIKQRQAKLPPAAVKVPPLSGGSKSNWGLLKSSFRGRSHLTSVLARSLGCIPVAGRGVGRWLGGGTTN